MARGMKWSSRDRDHFGEHWWTDWLNKLRIKHVRIEIKFQNVSPELALMYSSGVQYLWENPGVWDDQIVGTNMKSTVDSPSWHERAQNKIKYWLGLRNQTIFDVEFEDWHGIYSSRITLENDYMEYLNCFQFSDHIKNENVPGIIVLHDKWGITPDIIHCARFLKSHGYTVYVPDLYRGKRPFSHKDADDMMQRFDLQLAYADIDAAMRINSPFRSVGCLGVGTLGTHIALAAHAEFRRPDENFDGLVVVGCGAPMGSKASSESWRDNADLYVYPETDYGFLQAGAWYAKNREMLGLENSSSSSIRRLVWDRILSFFRRTCKPDVDLRPKEEHHQRYRDEMELTVQALEYEGAIPRIPFIKAKVDQLTYVDPDMPRLGKTEKKDLEQRNILKLKDTNIEEKLASLYTLGHERVFTNIFQRLTLQRYRKKRFRKSLRRKEYKRAKKANPKLIKSRKIYWESDAALEEAYEADPNDQGYVLHHPDFMDTDIAPSIKRVLSPSTRRMSNRKILFGDGLRPFTHKPLTAHERRRRANLLHAARPPSKKPKRKLPPPPQKLPDSPSR
eukprot:jgi/Bigna1/82317/fgenesh1_pg.91_\